MSLLALISRRLPRPALRFLLVLAFTARRAERQRGGGVCRRRAHLQRATGGGRAVRSPARSGSPPPRTPTTTRAATTSTATSRSTAAAGATSAAALRQRQLGHRQLAGDPPRPHPIYCTAKGGNGSTAQTGSPRRPRSASSMTRPPRRWGPACRVARATTAGMPAHPASTNTTAATAPPGGTSTRAGAAPATTRVTTPTCYAETAAGLVGAGSTGLSRQLAPSVSTAISGGGARRLVLRRPVDLPQRVGRHFGGLV